MMNEGTSTKTGKDSIDAMQQCPVKGNWINQNWRRRYPFRTVKRIFSK